MRLQVPPLVLAAVTVVLLGLSGPTFAAIHAQVAAAKGYLTCAVTLGGGVKC
jgi:hypothetical protein